MISLYVNALLCMLQHIVVHAMQHSGVDSEHKYAAIRFLYNRLNCYQLHETEYQLKENIIQNILHNNSFPLPPREPKTQADPPPYNAPTKQK